MNDWQDILKRPPLTPEEEQEVQSLMRFRNMDRDSAERSVRKKSGKMGATRQPVGRMVKGDIQEILKKKKKLKGYNKKIHAKTGGLSAKGRAKFKRETGANLKRPVTKKPSKLKPGGKAAKRRKSFCARSRGFKRADGTYSEKAKAARRRWNC